jgi:hypothetical protein
MDRSPGEILDEVTKIIDTGIVTSILVTVEYLDSKGEVRLGHARDSGTAIWKHYGMAKSAMDDIAASMTEPLVPLERWQEDDDDGP